MAVKEKGCFYCDPDHQGRKDLMIEVGQMSCLTWNQNRDMIT